MSKPSNFSQFKWKVANLDGQFLELGVGLRNDGRGGLEFQGYPIPASNKPN